MPKGIVKTVRNLFGINDAKACDKNEWKRASPSQQHQAIKTSNVVQPEAANKSINIVMPINSIEALSDIAHDPTLTVKAISMCKNKFSIIYLNDGIQNLLEREQLEKNSKEYREKSAEIRVNLRLHATQEKKVDEQGKKLKSLTLEEIQSKLEEYYQLESQLTQIYADDIKKYT